MANFVIQEVIDLYESVIDIDEENKLFKQRISENNNEIKEKFKAFASEKEVTVENLKKGFTHWKVARLAPDPKSVEGDLFSLIADIDIYLDEENKKEE